jgi:NhaP-type Na+/H+ or K+/H+ antiporter
VALGSGLARLGWRLRVMEPKHDVLDDLVGLGLIAVVYGRRQPDLKAWGFLAVFFAGVALRQTELVLAGAPKDRQGMLDRPTPPNPKSPRPAKRRSAADIVSAESLVFKEHLERLSELTLVLLLGGMISVHQLELGRGRPRLFLFVVARPLSV